MRKLLQILPLLILSVLTASAQHPGDAREGWLRSAGKVMDNPGKLTASGTDSASVAEAALHFLNDKLGELQDNRSRLAVADYRLNPYGSRLVFTQTFDGIPVYGTEVTLSLTKDLRIMWMAYKLADTRTWASADAAPALDQSRLKKMIPPVDLLQAEAVWYYQGNGIAEQSWRTEYGLLNGSLHNEDIYSTDYELLYRRQLQRRISSMNDTPATAYVFYPDPLTSSERPYGSPYVDANDSGIAVLNEQRVAKTINTVYRDSLYRLEGPYALITELSPPFTAPTTSTDGIFDFSRQDAGFEDVNAFFHIENYALHVQRLGFGQLSTQVKVDAHGLNGEDNSLFDFTGGNLTLTFGEGGIDDAEDADVVVHEYTHLLSYNAAGNNAYGAEREAIEEGMADYLSASYSKAISTYNWERLYNWDGNETWEGRPANSQKKYPKDLQYQKYRDGEMWCGTMMDLQDKLGRDVTDALALGLLYHTTKYMTMKDAAFLLVKVDSLQNGGANAYTIAAVFRERGMLPDTFLSVRAVAERMPDIQVNMPAFASAQQLSIRFGEPLSGKLLLLTADGKQVFSQTYQNTSNLTATVPGSLSAGIYLLRIDTASGSRTVKLVR